MNYPYQQKKNQVKFLYFLLTTIWSGKDLSHLKATHLTGIYWTLPLHHSSVLMTQAQGRWGSSHHGTCTLDKETYNNNTKTRQFQATVSAIKKTKQHRVTERREWLFAGQSDKDSPKKRRLELRPEWKEAVMPQPLQTMGNNWQKWHGHF